MTETSTDFLQMARHAFTASDDYFNASIRRNVEQDIRQAQGLHPSGSKYTLEGSKGRSKLFRPRTRAAIRKSESVAAEAFFSTVDVVNVSAEDDEDERQQASADFHQHLLNYRLQKSIPWFMTVIGAYQDALTTGVVASYQYWHYDEKRGIDKPCIKIIPIENLRIDAAADWTDPICSSPYVIEMIPMYVKDVKYRMQQDDPKTGQKKWKTLEESQIIAAAKQTSDTIRLQREHGRTDSKDQTNAVTDYSIVWVHKNIMEHDGEDILFFTMGTEALLSDPVPLKERYHTGKRPYVIGQCMIETHKLYPGGTPRISRDTQAEINDIANLRIDNVKFALNKRYFVKRNKQVDLRSLMRNVPGSATLMDDPKEDVVPVDFKDVTSSSYEEQDRLNLDFDDITGSFSGSSVQSNREMNETVGGMELLTDDANQVGGYMLRTFVETWVEPVLRQVIQLEQAYETDEVILALAGQKAQLIQKYGVDEITDELINRELTLNVNVGMGATNPFKQIKKFMQGMNSLRDLLSDGTLMNYNLDVKEVIKELFGKLGYRDGGRFFKMKGQDPTVTALQNMVQSLQQQLAQKVDPRLVDAQIAKLMKEVEGIDFKNKDVAASAVEKGVRAAFSAMQAGEIIAAVPQIAPVADKVMQAAGYQSPVPAGVDPNYPTASAIDTQGVQSIDPVKNPKTGIGFMPGVAGGGDTSPNTPMNPAAPASPESAGTGAMKGIETMRPDSIDRLGQQAKGYKNGGMMQYANGGLLDLNGQELDKDNQTGMLRDSGGNSVSAADMTFEQNQYNNALLNKQNQALWGTGTGKAIDDHILRRFADGGLIAGPGTGTSDSIPATVDGAPAAVSNGEFHIPAAVVAAYGIDFFEQLVTKFHTPAEGEAVPGAGNPLAMEQNDFIVPADVVDALGADFFQHLIDHAPV